MAETSPVGETSAHSSRLSAADRRLALALEAAGIGVWQSELGAGRLELDANLAALFGYARSPITLPDADWIGHIHPDDRTTFLAQLTARRDDRRPLSAEFRVVWANGTVRWLAIHGSVVYRPDGTPFGSVGLGRDVSERNETAARLELLLHELNHRVNNSIAAVLALAQQTAAGSETLADFMPAFQSRVMALTQAHNLLTRKNWSGVALGDLIAAIVAPEQKADPGRISMTGPDYELSSRQALSLTLALHELATNARKYGALSSPAGKVAIAWAESEGPDSKRIELTWIERGGPAVSPPVRKGFGSRLLTQALGRSLDASVRLEFPPSGVRCTIEFAQENPSA